MFILQPPLKRETWASVSLDMCGPVCVRERCVLHLRPWEDLGVDGFFQPIRRDIAQPSPVLSISAHT